MEIGDKFTYKGIEYSVTEVMNKGRGVKGMADIEYTETDIDGKVVTRVKKKPIAILVADINGK